MSTIRVGIFDDHPVVSSGLAAHFGSLPDAFEVAFAVGSKAAVVEALAVELPDVLILDIIAPDVQGLDLFAELTAQYNSLKIIAYTSLKGPILVENLLSMGVMGFVSKLQPLDDLLACVHKVDAGTRVVPEKYQHLLSRYYEPSSQLLTARELEIVRLVAEEATTQAIAERLGISMKTVENHRVSIYKKLDVKNVAGLILALTRLGYLS